MFRSKDWTWMVAALALASSIADAQQVAPLRVNPNALLAIDQNRPTVVDRIVANWGEALVRSGAGVTLDQLREVLNGLRADHLLAASLAGTLPGLRDVMANALTTTAAVTPVRVQAKALGDANDDLVYTPVVPCRILDTRNGTTPPYNAPMVGGVVFPVAANLPTFASQGGAATSCGLPTSFSAIVVTLTVLNPNFDAFLAASSSSNFATLTQSVVMDFSANRGLANTAIVPVDGTVRFYLGLPAQVTTQVIGDVMGYFKAPGAPIGTVSSVATGAGLTGGPITTSGTVGLAATQLLPTSACASNQIPKWSGSAWTCAADANSGGTVSSVATGTGLTGGPITTAGTVSLAAGYQLPQGAPIHQTLRSDGSVWQSNPLLLARDDGGVVMTGTFGSGTIPIEGGGGRLMWYPGKAAFRAGYALNSQWNDVNIGLESIALGYNTVASGANSTSIGGTSTASGLGAATIGWNNIASASYAIAIGNSSTSSADYATVAGGSGNTASTIYSTVAGGQGNTASGGSSTVAGGANNTAHGSFSFVAGGVDNIAQGAESFAGGSFTRALYPGEFVWADGSSGLFEPSNAGSPLHGWPDATNTFNVRATGGVWFVTATAIIGGVIQPTAGPYVNAGSGTWAATSDRAVKENFRHVDSKVMLAKVVQMPIESWNYTAEGAHIRHLGPVSQDFWTAFGLGRDDKSITSIDEGGVALAAIQGLNAKLDDAIQFRDRQLELQAATIREQQRQLADLRDRLEKAESTVADIVALKATLAELLHARETVAVK